MLRITMNKSAAGAKKYYSDDYYKEGNNNQLDYYSEKDAAIGKWGGKGAVKLKLNEEIIKCDFADLCDNVNPVSGDKLTQRNDKDRTVGYDFTFNASKSVSLAYSFGDDGQKREILNAFQAAVTDTMAEIETGMLARVRAKGRNENRETGNIIYGEFTHSTTRPVDGVTDPHLHSHCFVFNATYDDKDEKWKAGQFRQLKQDAPYYEAYFHSKLAEKLSDAGYGINRTAKGLEIEGVEKETADKFSRRTKEIENHAAENNITDEKQKAKIGARTREAKRSNVDRQAEFYEWKSRLTDDEYYRLSDLKGCRNDKDADGSGFDNSRAKDSCRNDKSAGDAVEYALKHHMERKSVAGDKEILATAIKSSVGEAKAEDIKKKFYNNADIISVKSDNRTFITTKDALNEEKQLIVNASGMRGKFRPVNEDYRFKSDLLNDQQKRAVKYALSTTDGITIISGKAGTGKTTLMKEVKQGIEEAGKKIYAFAPSAEASRVVQREEGFTNADTLQLLIKNKAMQEQLKNQVIWIDEAGKASNKNMNDILRIAKEQNARVILSGDVGQHNSVERGDALRVMQQYSGIVPVTVDKIQRQKNSDYRQAVQLLSEAKVEKGFKKLDNMGVINEIADRDERIKAVADDYYQSSFKGRMAKNILVISPTHAEGEQVTYEIRRRLKENKLLGPEDKEFAVLKNLQFTEAEKGRLENYRVGLVLGFHQNIRGVKAGSKLQVTGINGNEILAGDDKGREYRINLALAKRFNVYEQKEIEVSAGDKIKITGNGRAKDGRHLFNGTTYEISGFDSQGDIRLSNGSVLPKDYGHFHFGYVMTSHAAQGKTTDKIIISQSSSSFRASGMEQFYVSVSRGRQATAIYTDDKDSLLQAVSQSGQRLSATELLKSGGMRDVVEHGRVSWLERVKNNLRDSFEKFVQSKNKAYELSRAD